ncbi:short-chain dehydrogenase [Mycolicibacterium duvalii]|uniref:Short-chain dehydrogenase n=1 Tax=Mycolicibacterium duvalii TaxID=39688 RepID=A0A7I7K0Q5_9MYCO|nr:SDR family NAD(P)-dependent oxidoreductase [Mycolicibacterium duvalii]MCV7370874.1 SDR family oxidoreductase [Mycolicibacterium duvalii]PEG41311.1 short-chain dehydrogenase [Mycolicibacterium duvalii]BBX17128.1 short-chain dehydrogenase [Mycolicibacterium duvalii]
MDLGLQGATVAITGGTAGMGRATAECYARDGARVAVLARTRSAFDEVVASLRDAGSPDALGIVTDVSDPDSVTAAFGDLADRWGSLNVLVNTVGAGATIVGEFDALDDWKWDEAFDLITMGAVRACRAALPLLRKAEWARIVNVSAHSVQRQSPRLIAYTAGKAALTSLTKNLSQTLAKEEILVNTVSPGTFLTAQIRDYVATEIAARGLDPADPVDVATILEEMFGDALGQLGRAGLPEEIAPMITMLGSQRNTYTTGADLNVDGGSDFR